MCGEGGSGVRVGVNTFAASVTNVASALWAFRPALLLVVPGLAYKLFIIRAQRSVSDEDVESGQ